MVIVDNEILQGFYQEAQGYIPDIRSGMKALKSAPRDQGSRGRGASLGAQY